MGTPERTADEQYISEQYAAINKTVTKVAKDLCLPFLEIKLYRKFFLDAGDKEHLQGSLMVVNYMLDHKRLTLKVLESINEREEVLAKIKQLAFKYTTKTISTLDVQAQAFQLLYALQQATLHTIETIVQWRGTLTRPYPFIWKGVNYMLRVIGDCQFIDSCELSKVLPLQLTTHPLCSNLASLPLLGGGGGVKGRPGSASFPMKKRYAHGPEEQARIQRVETAIYEEHGMQKRLLRELSAISAGGSFLPLLNLSSIIPNCTTGVKLTNKVWDTRFHSAISSASSLLDNNTVIHYPAGKEQPQQLSQQGMTNSISSSSSDS